MAEVGLRNISIAEASLRLARNLALRILSEGLDPLAYTGNFEALWIRSDYAPEMQRVGSLDDQKAIAYYIGQSQADLREFSLGVLRDFTVASESKALG